jgi:hypothetical protein
MDNPKQWRAKLMLPRQPDRNEIVLPTVQAGFRLIAGSYFRPSILIDQAASHLSVSCHLVVAQLIGVALRFYLRHRL